MKKTFNSWKDIHVGFDDDRERWIVNLKPLGLTPGRPSFRTKPEAVECAPEAFERYLDPEHQPVGSGAPAASRKVIKDITLGKLLKIFWPMI